MKILNKNKSIKFSLKLLFHGKGIIFLLSYFFIQNIFSQKITFSEHIAPIIYKNCSPCHRKGEIGPFTLITYKDVSSRAKMIQRVTETRYMPPWSADAKFSSFLDERILSDEEISLIKKWTKNGAQQGNQKHLPALPDFTEGSKLGKPDLILKMQEPFKISGNNRDSVVWLKIPFKLPEEINVEAFEFRAGNKKLVHHAHPMIFDMDRQPKIFKDEQDIVIGDRWEENTLVMDTFSRANLIHYGIWVPGGTPEISPEDIGFRLPKNGLLLLEIHYGPSSIEQIDTSYVNIFFKKKNISRFTRLFSLGTSGRIAEPKPFPFLIPPDTVMTYTIESVIPFDISIISIVPHMHLIGKKMTAVVITPDHDTIPLIRINEWRFNWQGYYRPKKIIKIPAESKFFVEAVFDNTSNNPSNPFSPPREIEAGWKTTNEMFNFIFIGVPYKKGDEDIPLNALPEK